MGPWRGQGPFLTFSEMLKDNYGFAVALWFSFKNSHPITSIRGLVLEWNKKHLRIDVIACAFFTSSGCMILIFPPVLFLNGRDVFHTFNGYTFDMFFFTSSMLLVFV